VVAVAAERVMDTPSKLRDQRVRVLNRARALARSGQHPDHKSVLAELEPMKGFAETLDRLQLIRSQLGRCALAQSGRPRMDSPGRTTSPTWTPGRALRQLP
jgi:hypothetical protein